MFPAPEKESPCSYSKPFIRFAYCCMGWCSRELTIRARLLIILLNMRQRRHAAVIHDVIRDDRHINQWKIVAVELLASLTVINTKTRPFSQRSKKKRPVGRFVSNDKRYFRRNATTLSPCLVPSEPWPPAAITTYCLPSLPCQVEGVACAPALSSVCHSSLPVLTS